MESDLKNNIQPIERPTTPLVRVRITTIDSNTGAESVDEVAGEGAIIAVNKGDVITENGDKALNTQVGQFGAFTRASTVMALHSMIDGADEIQPGIKAKLIERITGNHHPKEALAALFKKILEGDGGIEDEDEDDSEGDGEDEDTGTDDEE